jgi:hypothetical protein
MLTGLVYNNVATMYIIDSKRWPHNFAYMLTIESDSKAQTLVVPAYMKE